MNISVPFIARPIATLLLSIGMMLAGIIAYQALPVAPLPNVDFPVIAVLAARPGADPETMANSIAAPLERRLGEIPGVDELSSTSTVGNATVIVQFGIDRDIDSAARDVQAAINAAATDLPTDLPTRPFYRKFNPNDQPVLQLALTSKIRSTAEVYDAVDTVLAQRLAQVDGVAQVTINGAEKPAVRIQMDPVRAAAAGINPQDVFNAVRSANVTEPTGALQTPARAFSIATNGQIGQADDYAPLVLKTSNGAVVRVRDVAHVTNATANSRLAAWSGRDPAILLSVTKLANANVIDTVDRVKAALPQILGWMPPDIESVVIQDRTTTIRASVNDTQYTLLATIALVLCVVAVFMRRVGPTLAAAVTVPLSLAGTLAGMWFCGFALDNFSLMALTISVGFVVDDAIVMIENIARLRDTGLSPLRAAIEGSRQIGFTVISISLSLVAVFIPILFMGGILGKLLNEFAVTLTLAILLSATVSLVVTPMISARLMPNEGAPGGWWGRADRAIDAAFRAMARRYVASLGWSLRNTAFMLLVMAITIAVTIQLYKTAPKGFLPNEDTGLVLGQTIASPDISFAAMVERQQRAVEILLADPDVLSIGSTVGVASGWSSPNRGTLSITLRDYPARTRTADQLIQDLRAPLNAVGGLQTFMYSAQDLRGGGAGGGGGSQFQFSVVSENLDDMRAAALALEDKLKTVGNGITDVNSDQDRAGPQMTVRIDRDAASRVGVTVTDIDNALNNALSQRQITTIYTDRNQYRVVLEADPAIQADPTALARLYVAGRGGKQVPLASVAAFVPDSAPLQVRHLGAFPAGNIFFNTPPGTALGDAVALIDSTVASMTLPAGVHVQFAGNAKFLTDSLKSQPILIGAALLAIYIVLGVLYESVLHPLTIVSTLPSAGLGALLALRVTGNDLGVIGIIGIVLLMGIVKKNGIMLVDFALEQERDHGLAPREAILEACRERFRPILMTTLAALLGALPLALSFGTGAELRRPLGIAISGGLVVSQILTLYTTPVIYLALERLARVRGRARIAVPAE